MACCQATPVVISCTRPPPESQCIKVNVPPQCVTCVVPPPQRSNPPPKMVNIPVVICEREESSCGNGRNGNGRNGNGMSGNGRNGNGRNGSGRNGSGRNGSGRNGNGMSGNGMNGNGISVNLMSCGQGGQSCPPPCCPPSCCKPSCQSSCGPPSCGSSCCKPSCGGEPSCCPPPMDFPCFKIPDTTCCQKPKREKRWPMCNFLKPCIDTRIYRDGEALCISYAGHIPGEQFIHGRNLPTTTTFAKRRLCQYTPYEFIDPDGCCTFP